MLLTPLRTNTPSSSIANSEATAPSQAEDSLHSLYLPNVLFTFFIKTLTQSFPNFPEFLHSCGFQITEQTVPNENDQAGSFAAGQVCKDRLLVSAHPEA